MLDETRRPSPTLPPAVVWFLRFFAFVWFLAQFEESRRDALVLARQCLEVKMSYYGGGGAFSLRSYASSFAFSFRVVIPYLHKRGINCQRTLLDFDRGFSRVLVLGRILQFRFLGVLFAIILYMHDSFTKIE